MKKSELKELIREVIRENDPAKLTVGQQVTSAFTGFASGITDSLVARAAALAAQGRYDEADACLRGKLSPDKLQVVSAWMRQNIKPYPQKPSTGQLLNSPEFSGWISQKFLPYIKSIAKINETKEKKYQWEKEKTKTPLKETDERWTNWVSSMVGTVEDTAMENGEKYTDAYEAYDILKSNFRADSPSRDMFEKACKEAIDILKKSGKVK